MSAQRERLEESWATLTAARYGSDEIRVEPTGTRVADGEVLAGLDAQGRRYLLVPLEDERDAREDHHSAGVQIEIRELTEGRTRRRYAAVVCLMPAFNDIFATLAADMLAALAATAAAPGTALLDTLDRWRGLLERPASRLLGPQQLAGLFGELQIVRDLVARNPARGVDAWTGPAHDAHDFVTGSCHLEVKATTIREGRIVEIHGAGQLAVPPDSQLWLTIFRLEVGAGGVSVPELVADILGLGVREKTLLELLAAGGYDHLEADAYQGLRFAAVERRTYLVDDFFPRIVPESFNSGIVPPGVLRLRYDVDVTGEPPFPLDETAESELLDQLAHG